MKFFLQKIIFQAEYQTPSPADSAVHDLGNEDLKKTRDLVSGDHVHTSPSLSTVSVPSVPGDNGVFRKWDKKVGKKDVQKLKSYYEAQLKNFQQNALKMESSLVNQIHQV